MKLTNTLAHKMARNAATIAFADFGSGNSTIRLYTADGGDILATKVLTKPCGFVRPADGRIELTPASGLEVAEGQGGATWGTWCDGSGSVISYGRVTDTEGNYTNVLGEVVADPLGLGVFVMAGTSGTTVYIGGVVSLYLGLVG